jgi:serine/threonine protein phosphatase 1
MSLIGRFFGARAPRALPAVPAGDRVYAVGDVHGRADLFMALIEAIEADDRARSAANTVIVLLGDLVDRGPDSAQVIRAARELSDRRQVRMVCGNHEEMFLQSFERIEILQHFLRYGGKDTILSYPVDTEAFHAADLDGVQALMRGAVPEDDRKFIRAFEDFVAIGDYLFVHAGILPEEAIVDQSRKNLRWIREPFLSYPGDHGCVVVHGHTITPEPELLHNRIGIDTGAFKSGRLTALALEGSDRWLMEAREEDGAISSSMRTA